MPRIAEITKTHDGRPAVVLEPTGDAGAVSYYTEDEIAAPLAAEREACARIADERGGEIATEIAKAIRNRIGC